jgi:hypothetical protein
MNRYYKLNPRGFANEYTVYVVDAKQALDFESAMKYPTQITRAEAIEYGVRKPNWARRNSQQWFGGFARTADSEFARNQELCGDAATDSDEIRFAAIATAEIMAEMQER